jgi:predicted TIM-barrel fold metal-dependent hydrolase
MEDVLSGLKIVDCDTHWQEPADLWSSRVPAKYRDKMPQVRRVPVAEARKPHEFIGPAGILGPSNLPAGSDTAERSDLVAEGEIDRWYVGDRDFGWMTLWINKEGKKNRTTERIATIEAADPGSWDAKSRVAAMDRMGIWAHIMYPNVAGFGPSKAMLAWDDNELRNIFTSTYNDALAEVCHESNGRLFGQALLPVWDPKELVKEAQRAVDLGLKGFIIGDRPEMIGLPDYREPYWEPLWDFCNATRLPLSFHIGNSHGGFHYQIPWSSYKRDAARAISTTLLMMFNAGHMANFLLSGLFDRYPNLKFASVESGVGWIPYLLEQLEYQIGQTVTEPVERAMIGKRSPIEYFHDHFYSMFWSESLPIRTKEVREWIGVKNILFETDYPHYTSLYPTPRDHLLEVTKDMDDYTRRRILQDNAVELFQLPLPVTV